MNILFHIYKHNYNKCLILDYILYINAIIINVFFNNYHNYQFSYLDKKIK